MDGLYDHVRVGPGCLVQFHSILLMSRGEWAWGVNANYEIAVKQLKEWGKFNLI